MRKKFALVLIVLLLVQNFVAFAEIEDMPVGNTPEQDEHNRQEQARVDEIAKVINKLTTLEQEHVMLEMSTKNTTKSLISSKSLINNNGLDAQILALEAKLQKLGATAKNNKMTVQTFSSAGSYDRTWSVVVNRFYYNGLPYTVEHEYVAPDSLQSFLMTAGDGVSIYTGNAETSPFSTILNIYGQKAIGAIPGIGWMPYELLLTTNVSRIEKIVINYTISNTVCYSWVKPYSASDSYYQRAMVTNNPQIQHFFTTRGFDNNGNPLTEPSNVKAYNAPATTYANTYRAVNSYVDLHNSFTEIVDYMSVDCTLEGGIVKLFKVTTPM